MADRPDGEQAGSRAAGHVSVHLDDIHPPEVSFSFEAQRGRASGAGVVSLVFHALAIIIVVTAPAWMPDTPPVDLRQSQENVNRIVFLNTPGPGGGGGGGGKSSAVRKAPEEGYGKGGRGPQGMKR